MKQKGRYNIRLAEKKGIRICEVDKTEENIHIFYTLMEETTQRDKFSGNTEDYYRIFLNKIPESRLLFAYYKNTVIAAGIFIFHEKFSLYYYGASSGDEEHRKLMAPYLLQWEAIKIAKYLGAESYDFL